MPMDNEAFRALVAERSKPKSTKEIAREAVEQEFRDRRSRAGGKKRRRGGAGGGGGGGSSSDEDGGGRGAAAANEDDSDDDDVDRRNRDGRGGEDDGGDNDDDGNEKEPKWKRERRAKKRAKEEAEGKVRYRDRAKERREGRTNADYAGIEEAVAAAGASASGGADGAGDGVAVLGGAEADMTKYLGGDESRTHLVRGLDWALAQKVRREEMGIADGSNDNNAEEGGGIVGGDDDNLESILESSRAEKSDSEALRRAIHNLSSASSDRNDPRDVLVILNRLQNTAQTTSGRDMAMFLMNKTNRSSKMETTKKKLTTTNAGRTLQRTKLQFSLRCHPGDMLRSWEVPREEVSSVVEHERRRQKGSNVPFGEQLTPFDQSFLTRIKAALAPSMRSSSDKKISDTSKKGRDARKKSKNQEGVEVGEGSKDDAETTIPVISEEKQISAAEGNNDGGESSDEDIFGGVGQYQPSMPAATKDATGTNDKVPAAGKKKSIFEGLTSEPDPINKSKTSAPISNVPSVPNPASQEKNVIDRDVFGGRPVDKGTQAVRPSGGVSMSVSDYATGYGEDMDVDFTGADDDEAAKGKKGGDDLTTTAALEYGRRSGA